MSDKYISPKHATIGEYSIGEALFDTTGLDRVLSNLDLSVSDLYLSAADVSGKVDTISSDLTAISS